MTRRRQRPLKGHPVGDGEGTVGPWGVCSGRNEPGCRQTRLSFSCRIGELSSGSDETSLWLGLLQNNGGVKSEEIGCLSKETQELIAMFVTLIHKNE